MIVESWLPVVGWEGYYEVSDRGRVRSVDREIVTSNGRRWVQPGRILAPYPTPPVGYWAVSLERRPTKRRVRIHILVLEAFVGPRPDGLVGCHNDGNIDHNHPSNLRWDTQKENIHDTIRHGHHHLINKTRCPQGHEYTPENTYIVPSTGGRACRECRANNFEGAKPRKPRKLATHCGNGHPWNDQNTYISPKNGTRSCRACGREKARRKYQRLKREGGSA